MAANYKDNLIDFAGGMAYGWTCVAVGQPLDTIKTRMQAQPEALQGKTGTLATGLKLWRSEGIPGLYRGGMPLMVGGGLMRSAQFGVFASAHRSIKEALGPTVKFFGVLDYQVVLAGFIGGLGRGIVEGPTDYIKTRRQVAQNWSFTQMYQGTGVTLFRNGFLFMFFAVYADIWKNVIVPKCGGPASGGLNPFLDIALTANMAWLTVWPLDVVKSQMQSGNFVGQSLPALLRASAASGAFYRGLAPGLVRSTIANGSAGVMMKKTQVFLSEYFGGFKESVF